MRQISEMMLVLVVLLLGLTAAADANIIFPKQCVQGVTKFPVSCCLYFNGSQCGAAFNRGTCLPVPTSRAGEAPDVSKDERTGFPKAFFTYMCVCKENFDGFNCGGCAPNRYGDNCENTYIVTRREYRELSPMERERFLAQVHYCKSKMDPDSSILVSGNRFQSLSYQFMDATYYDVWCFIHYYATKPLINNTREVFGMNFAHQSSGFLTWHRFYLLHLEKSMQRCLKDPSFALVYYDWGLDQNCTACNNDWLGGNNRQGDINKESIFSTWKMVCANYDYDATTCLMSSNTCERPSLNRNPGSAPDARKSGAADIQGCLNLPNLDTPPYDPRSLNSFRNCLEGWVDANGNPGTFMHNLWHVYCGGTMVQTPISCNDPIFFMHHAFIDKMLEAYIKARGLTKDSYPADNPYPGHGAYSCITPFHTCVRNRDMLVRSYLLGYQYSVWNGI